MESKYVVMNVDTGEYLHSNKIEDGISFVKNFKEAYMSNNRSYLHSLLVVNAKHFKDYTLTIREFFTF